MSARRVFSFVAKPALCEEPSSGWGRDERGKDLQIETLDMAFFLERS